MVDAGGGDGGGSGGLGGGDEEKVVGTAWKVEKNSSVAMEHEGREVERGRRRVEGKRSGGDEEKREMEKGMKEQ